MKRTDTSDPDYFHQVVDCQWACPAHTDVPEYIRLIAQGRFTDAYMVNRESNVFPGILGRVCDRPCEPACRRSRTGQKPVAICRLKRVAADHRGDIEDLMPVIPEQKNGRKIALVGAGCASLTVCNDLMPLGYECTVFEALPEPGGLMRSNIPSFRLPGAVLNDELGRIVDMGVDLRLNTRVESMRELLEQGYDAVFVGSGAPRGKELKLPGRRGGCGQHPHRHHLAGVGGFRAHQGNRRARTDHRGGQYRHGLLPHVAAAGCEIGQGDGAQAPRLLQGVRLGTRGR